MRFLCIPLAGPLQSWGTRSRFANRDCERTPTKSGVLGIIAAALGIERGADIGELRSLAFGVRADREGILRREFQTTLDVASAQGGVAKDPQTSSRYYLADAVFLAAIGGDAVLIERVYAALRSPQWPLFLGRKSYVPSNPLCDPRGPFEAADIADALKSRPLLAHRDKDERVRIELDAENNCGALRYDDPISFDEKRRDYAARYVKTDYIPASDIVVGAFYLEANDVPKPA
jgi:CRISPR system Cascade subunit CasD